MLNTRIYRYKISIFYIHHSAPFFSTHQLHLMFPSTFHHYFPSFAHLRKNKALTGNFEYVSDSQPVVPKVSSRVQSLHKNSSTFCKLMTELDAATSKLLGPFLLTYSVSKIQLFSKSSLTMETSSFQTIFPSKSLCKLPALLKQPLEPLILFFVMKCCVLLPFPQDRDFGHYEEPSPQYLKE